MKKENESYRTKIDGNFMWYSLYRVTALIERPCRNKQPTYLNPNVILKNLRIRCLTFKLWNNYTRYLYAECHDQTVSAFGCNYERRTDRQTTLWTLKIEAEPRFAHFWMTQETVKLHHLKLFYNSKKLMSQTIIARMVNDRNVINSWKCNGSALLPPHPL